MPGVKSLKDYFWSNEEELLEQIKLSKNEYGVAVDVNYSEDSIIRGSWIPFNLERKYLDILIDESRYREAVEVIKVMRASYITPEFQNFIESYEYRIQSILHSNKNIQEGVQNAKKEFNQHTITLITVIVGLVTIFSTASSTLKATSFLEAVYTFFAISIPLEIVILSILYILNRNK